MKLFKVAAVAAIVVSASAFAGSVPQFSGHGGHNYGGPDSELSIYQTGSSNSALALQSDARDSTTTIRQNGSSNGADVGQGSDDSTISLSQNGFHTAQPLTSGTAETLQFLSASMVAAMVRWSTRLLLALP